MNISSLIIVLVSLFSIGNLYAYPASWTNFDASSLDGARDATIGNTQEMIAERNGQIECIFCHGELDDQYDGVITTDEIVTATTDATFECLNWELRGICIWLTCGFGCSIDYSTKVKNHVPDLVMQSYDRANGEPWTESQDINQVSQGDADSSWVHSIISLVESYDVEDIGVRGGISTQGNKTKNDTLYFKLVDAYGNPGLLAFNSIASASFGLICPGQTMIFYPYLISNLDSIAWRWDIPEMFYPMAWLPMVSTWNLGSSTNTYGGIYPRHGFMTQQDPAKAGVLAAFRAAHFITRPAEPHLYFTIFTPDRDGYWPAPPLDKDDPDTGIWQMLYPKMESQCMQFPYEATPPGERRSEDGNYVWNFWKSYKCCERRGQDLIFHSG